MSKNRIEQVIEYIKAHPEKSGNQIYIYSKIHGFGINKQKFYQIYRQEKIQPKDKPKKIVIKTIQNKRIIKKKTVQKKIIPAKQLIEKDKLLSEKLTDLIEYPKDPEYEYGLIEVYDKSQKESYWIKYHDKAHLDWQIDKLEASDKKRGYSPNYDFIYHGIKSYTPFISAEFEKIMNEMNGN